MDRKDFGICVLFILELLVLSSERDFFFALSRDIQCLELLSLTCVNIKEEELHMFVQFTSGDFLSLSLGELTISFMV